MKDENYEDKICKICVNKDKCNKDKYKRVTINDKTTIYCPDYLFEQINQD